jgi:ubiquinone/menaquinone biosynthesis C-methylase UbiE
MHQATAESMPLAVSSVDLVLCAVSMHQWSDSGAGLREVARVLRPGGRFCFADWVMADWLTTLLRAGAKTPEILKERFIRSDLQVVTQRPMVSRSLYVTIGVRK